MKIERPEVHTESSQLLKDVTFGVGDLSIVFDILRNKLYKDPVVALCREYICNARDAHREIGKKDVPVEVIFPGVFETDFKIRDFGPGIDPRRMEEVFIKYGSSTKRDTNEQTGAFGLGCKSAFAYSDSFQVVTVTDGMERTYTAYIDESLIGKMALLSEKESKDPNGTTIVVPMKKNDKNKFAQTVIELTQHWEVRPTLRNLPHNYAYQTLETIFKTDRWSYVKNPYDYNQRPVLIVDGIPYVFDNDSMLDTPELKAVGNLYILIEVKTGEISLSASRDSIHYDQKTKDFVKQIFKEVYDKFRERASTEIQDATNYPEAIRKFLSIPSQFKVNTYLEWQGKKVFTAEKSSIFGTHSKITTYTYRSRRGKYDVNAWGEEASDYRNVSFSELINPNNKLFKNLDGQLHRATVLDYFKENPNTKSVFIISKTVEKAAGLQNTNLHFAGEFNEELLDALGAESFEKIHIEKERKPRVVKKVEDNSKIIVHPLDAIRSTIIVDNKDFVYAIIDTKTMTASIDMTHIDYSLLEVVSSTFSVNVYLLPPSKLNKVDKSCKRLDVFLEEKAKEFSKATGMTLREYFGLSAVEDYFDKTAVASFLKNLEVFEKNLTLGTECIYYKYLKTLADFKKIDEIFPSIRRLDQSRFSSFINPILEKEKLDISYKENLEKIRNECISKYELLGLIVSQLYNDYYYFYGIKRESLIKYINQVDFFDCNEN